MTTEERVSAERVEGVRRAVDAAHHAWLAGHMSHRDYQSVLLLLEMASAYAALLKENERLRRVTGDDCERCGSVALAHEWNTGKRLYIRHDHKPDGQGDTDCVICALTQDEYLALTRKD